ncbi:MAG: hypothetical protein WBC19_11570 [Pyrinomonadaceae bacterium]
MRQVFIIWLLLSAVCVLISCGGPAERIKETAAITPTPSPTPGERDISGNFLINGAGSHDMDPYTGSLSVIPKGDNYEFRWATTKGTRVGTGVQLGSTAAVSFAATGAGKGCGVVLYKIASDGSFDGRSVLWGDEKFGEEKAVRVEGTGFVGKYMVTGTTADGKTYLGSLAIVKDGAGYDFSWLTDKPRIGFGIWRGSYAAVSFGGRQCSFALYDIQSNGSLEGNWGGQKQVTFGAETAKRQ